MPQNVVVVDVGSGTQDILIYQEGKNLENCPKFVVPSQTQIVAQHIRQATENGEGVFLHGALMGGGACGAALKKHLAAGLPAYATPEAARTFHDRLDNVEGMGVVLTDIAPEGTKSIRMGDIDHQAVEQALAAFDIGKADQYIIAVQDHGFSETESNRILRFRIWESFLCAGGDLKSLIYKDEIPPVLTRMQATKNLLPHAVLADTGTAALLGVMADPAVEQHLKKGIIAVNIGNSHTLAAAIRGERVYGLFEQHTGMLDTSSLADLVQKLQTTTISNEEVFSAGGHGAVLDHDMNQGWEFVVVTGPRRAMAKSLGWYEAAPFGDMMLTGCFGLLKGMGIL